MTWLTHMAVPQGRVPQTSEAYTGRFVLQRFGNSCPRGACQLRDHINIATALSRRGDVAVVTVAGDIDLATAPVLQSAIIDAMAHAPCALVIDLSLVDFLGSTGLRILVQAQNSVRAAGRFAVVVDGPTTSRPIQLMGLGEMLAMRSTLQEALAWVEPATGASAVSRRNRPAWRTRND
jgi:anti-sigma B factor antagonist